MVKVNRATCRFFVVVLGLFIAAAVTATGSGAAQPPPTLPTPTSPPPATPTPAPEQDPDATDPGEEQDEECEGHVRIPGIDVCTPIPDVGDRVQDTVADAGRAMFSDIVDWVLRGYIWITKYVWQLFIGVDVDASGSTSTVQRLNEMTGELQIIAAGLGLLVALMQILTHRMMLVGDDAAPEAFAGFLRWALAASLAAPALLSLSAASDALAQWMFTTAAGPQGPTHVVDALSAALSGRDARLKTEDVIALALCLLGLLAYMELSIQLFLQKAWMIYVAVGLPIAGAASVTGAGKEVFSAMLRLGVTVLLFKPIAALLFAVGFWQIRELGSGFDVVTAVLVMAAPAFCMPVLVNLIGNTRVGFAGSSMVLGFALAARAGKRFASNRARELGTGMGEAKKMADSMTSGGRAQARAAAAPSPNRTGPAGNSGSTANSTPTQTKTSAQSGASSRPGKQVTVSAASTAASGGGKGANPGSQTARTGGSSGSRATASGGSGTSPGTSGTSSASSGAGAAPTWQRTSGRRPPNTSAGRGTAASGTQPAQGGGAAQGRHPPRPPRDTLKRIT